MASSQSDAQAAEFFFIVAALNSYIAKYGFSFLIFALGMLSLLALS